MPTENPHEEERAREEQAGGSSGAKDRGPRESGPRQHEQRERRQQEHPAAAHRGREAHDESRHEGKPSRKDLEIRIEELSSQVESLGAEIKDAKDRYLRALADFDNYRKRVTKENEERTRCANEELIKRLLEVIDNMERAVDASASAKDFEGLRKGLELTYLSLKEILTKEGLCPINCLGEKFDPNYHEAIMAIEKEGREGDSVLEEVQKGYLLKGRVIRPSKVVVSK